MNRLDSSQSRLFEDEEKKQEMEQEGKKANTDSECAFCEIARDHGKSHVVFQDALSIGFLDRRPVFFGHCLLIPRNHYQTLYDLPEDLLFPLFRNTQLLGRAIETALNAEGTFIGINNRVSQSVPHLHVHLIPRKSGDGLRGFFWPRRRYDSEQQMSEIAGSIRKALERIDQGSKAAI
jgi:histidine triad (HIT) family protein